MSIAKAEVAPDPVDSMSLKEIRELLHELERLGFVKRTGEFENGNPVFVSTLEGDKAIEMRRNKEG